MSRSEHAASNLPPFAAAFTAGTRFARKHGRPIEMSTRQIGDFLRIPSGRVVVGDPGLIEFAAPPPPFAREAPIGVFPVELALADFGYDSMRVACARVRFSAGPAVRWEPAPFAGHSAADSVYEVFHDVGCFFDAAAHAAVDEATTQIWWEAMVHNRESGWMWHVAEVGGANVVMFSTGRGGGCGASYWGLGEQGGLVELVTDFGLLHEPVSEQLELSLPLPHGEFAHPWLAARGISVRGLQWAETIVIIRGPKEMSFCLSERMVPCELVPCERWTGNECRLEWKRNTPGLRLVISVSAGTRPLVPL